jgi:hypothetical protein
MRGAVKGGQSESGFTLSDLLCVFSNDFAPLREQLRKENAFHAKTQRKMEGAKRT